MGKGGVDPIRPINRLLTLILEDWQRTTESCVPPDSITEPKTPASPLNIPPYHDVQSHFILSNVYLMNQERVKNQPYREHARNGHATDKYELKVLTHTEWYAILFALLSCGSLAELGWKYEHLQISSRFID